MASRATAGEFLEAASAQLSLARAIPEPEGRPSEIAEIAWSLGQITYALSRYLGDTGAAGYLMTGDAPSLHGWPRTVVEARECLRQGFWAFGYSRIRQARPVSQNRTRVAVCLTAAAKALTVTRDLLQTHFAPDRTYASEWAPVIASPQITRALAAEVSWWAWQIAPMAARLATTGTSPSARSEDVRHRLRGAARSLWAAAQTLDTALLTEPATAEDLMLLRAIPVNSMPAQAFPQGTETVAQLCEGVISTAERVRQETWKPAPASSPAISETTLRHTGGMAVIISHNCAIALDALTSRADHLGLTNLRAGLVESAAAASAAQARWLDAARVWGRQVFTDTRGTRSRLGMEAEDLALWTGRLVYRDPQWAPAHGRLQDLRPREALAPDPAQIRRVMTALHHVGETLSRLADTEHDRVRAIGNAGRLYLPTRSLPEKCDVPLPYGPALPEHLRALLATYLEVRHTSARLADSLAQVAVPMDIRRGILVTARVAPGASGEPITSPASSEEPALHRPLYRPEEPPPWELAVSQPRSPAGLARRQRMWPDEWQQLCDTAYGEGTPVGRGVPLAQQLSIDRMNLRRYERESVANWSATRDGPGQDGRLPEAPRLHEREAE